jgi:amidase
VNKQIQCAGAALLLACGWVSALAEPEALDEMSVAQLQERMAGGDLTSHALTAHFIARIETLDRSGPRLNSVVEVNPDALAIADALDAERSSGRLRGPLHGIPILLKDNIDTADRMLTTAGSLALLDSRPERDAFIVTRLREAGVVILGKTNLSEWANFRSTRSSSGWSGRGGQTRNPYALDRNPCGSSSGSGTAIAAGLAVMAVGTETDGSIVCPSSVNGIVGIKPTLGLVSRTGIIPIAASQDTAGPMARTVADAALLLAAMIGADPEDQATQRAGDAYATSYAASLRADALQGARVGVARNLAGFHEAVDAALGEAVERLKAAGAVVVDPANLVLPDDLGDDEFTVLLYEFKDGLNRYLAGRPGAPRTLASLIEFNERERAREMPYFGQEIFIMAEAKGPLTDRAYRRAHARTRTGASRAIDTLLRRHRLDVIITPTVSPAWTTDLVNGDHVIGGNASQAPAIAGYPHVTVPMGQVHGLPVGLSFIGAAGRDGALIGYAHAFEGTRQARVPPALSESRSLSLGSAGEAR